MYDLIIIGGGPAGVAAGIYAARKRLKTALISQDIGGQSVNSGSIENFIGIETISGFDFAQQLEKHLRAQQDIDIFLGSTVSEITTHEGGGFDVRVHTGKVFSTKTILVALGSSYKRLDIPGEKQFEGKGVFYCSICDAPLMKGKDVIVVGGGNSGLEAVLDLIPYAQHVTLLNRSDVLRGDPVYQEKITSYPHVSIRMNTVVTEFSGDVFLQQAHLRNTSTGQEEDMAISGAFVAIGYNPNTALIKDLVTLNERGQIVVDHKTMQTSREGIWSAGDCTDGLYHQNNTAAGDAVKAILNIYETLR
ncbi:MAG: FAD-dependent oxidoreductase [Candidatus Paceibacterota bacterium]